MNTYQPKDLTDTMFSALIMLAEMGGAANVRNTSKNDWPTFPIIAQPTMDGLASRGYIEVQGHIIQGHYGKPFRHDAYKMLPKGWRVYAQKLAAMKNRYYDRLAKIQLRFDAIELMIEVAGNGLEVHPVEIFRNRYNINLGKFHMDLIWHEYLKSFIVELHNGNLKMTYYDGRYEVWIDYQSSYGTHRWLAGDKKDPSRFDVIVFSKLLAELQRIADFMNEDMASTEGHRLDPFTIQASGLGYARSLFSHSVRMPVT